MGQWGRMAEGRQGRGLRQGAGSRDELRGPGAGTNSGCREPGAGSREPGRTPGAGSRDPVPGTRSPVPGARPPVVAPACCSPLLTVSSPARGANSSARRPILASSRGGVAPEFCSRSGPIICRRPLNPCPRAAASARGGAGPSREILKPLPPMTRNGWSQCRRAAFTTSTWARSRTRGPDGCFRCPTP